MEISGFHITIHGDRSVGIFDNHIRLEGKFSFSDEEELNTYIIGLKDLHEQTFDAGVTIETFEEAKQKVIDELISKGYYI